VTSSKGKPLDETVTQRISQILKEKSLAAQKIESESDQSKLLLRFKQTEMQLAAADALKEGLGKDYIVALNLAPATPTWLRALNADPMYLGLDLRGGVHFLMEVDTSTVLDKNLNPYVRDFKDLLRNDAIRYSMVARKDKQIIASFKEVAIAEAAFNRLKKEYSQQLDISKSATGLEIYATINAQTLTSIKRFAIKQNIITLRKRVNELGVAEPIIQQQGLDRIVVQLPGVQDTARAKEILGATATLEFRMVDEQNSPFQAKSTGRIPSGSKLYNERNGQPILLKRQVMLQGDHIIDAQSGLDENGQPSVSITLDSKGSKKFAKVTGKNVKKLMSVVFIETKIDSKRINGKLVNEKVTTEEVINVARIQEQLSKRFQITGLDSSKESRNLALLLRAGALAAPVYIVEERTVGPSLGQQNIDNGYTSVKVGFILVLIFMALYYKVFGLVANVALSLNLVLIVAILSIMQATLTLPGIAGIVLTVGMAVDANVLIYERIKEELRNGVTPQTAIKVGYEKAVSTIADANITTLIAAIVLFGFGTGAIKGFAITLAIGIVSSMFTAILVTRAIINLIYGNRRITKLAI
jgi:preprotein translocase subunit SecD